ncbi:MAG: response regulator [Candidatus Omnitrophica bacterium]|nr:response regulator [Candidatus Omnitrophota bacterium]
MVKGKQRRKKVLVVDDDEGMTMCLSDILEMKGFATRVAHDGVEAIEKVKEEKFDVVLMDIKMPRMDGIQASKEIHALLPDMVIFLITGYSSDYESDKVVQGCVREVISKPFDFDMLIERINECV